MYVIPESIRCVSLLKTCFPCTLGGLQAGMTPTGAGTSLSMFRVVRHLY